MLSARIRLAAIAPLVALQTADLVDFEPFPPHPLDRVVALEIPADAPPVGEHGPAAWVEERARFAGTLHVWVEGGGDPFLRVQSESGEPLAEDDDSGGGRTPYLRLQVEPELALRIAAAGAPGATLHLVAAPETDETLAAGEALGKRLQRVDSLLRAGDADQARAVLGDARSALEKVAGADASESVSEAAWPAGYAAYRAGDPAAAARWWTRTLRHRARVLPPDHLDLLSAYSSLGTMLWMAGDAAAGEPLLEHGLAGYERSLPPDHRLALMVRMNLGSIRREAGDLQGARVLLESVLAGFERTLPQDDKLLLDALHNLAAVREDSGDREGARVLQERVLEGYERLLPEDDLDLQTARANLAHTLHEMGELEGARELFERVLAIREARMSPANPELVSVRLNLAGLEGDLGHHPRARELLEDALTGCEEALAPLDPLVLRTRFNLASELAQAGDLEGAARLGREVLSGFESALPEGHHDRLLAREDLALTELELGDVAAARTLVAELVEHLSRRTVRAGLLAPRETREVLTTDRGLLRTCLLLGGEPPDLARDVFELIETRRRVAASNLAGARLTEHDPELSRLASEAAAARAALNDLIAGSAREGAAAEELRADLAALTESRDSAEREIRAALASRGVVIGPVSLPAVAAALPLHSAAVAFLRHGGAEQDASTGRVTALPERLLAHVVRPSGALARIDLGRADELEALVERWRATLGKPVERGTALLADANADLEREAGAALRRRILDPVLNAAGEEVVSLRVLPDDLVYLVPLDALPVGGPGHDVERVGDRLRISTLTSFGELLEPLPSQSGEPTLVVLGNAAFDTSVGAPRVAGAAPPIEVALRGSGLPRRFPPLVQTAYEIESVAESFRRAFDLEPVVLTGEDASKSALFEQAPGMRYVHLATHGWFAPETVRSELDAGRSASGAWRRVGLAERVTGFAPMTLCGLALAGANRGRDSAGRVPGILTAEELCGLDLACCRLAVLSACETQVGIRRAGQGIQSLQAAARAAGARATVTSLWKVDDAATRRLMEHFYGYLWTDRLPLADALWRAKRDLRDAGHPVRDWAGWVLSGDPG